MKKRAIVAGVLIAIIFALYLEIYKNTLLGWILAAVVVAAFFFARVKMGKDSKWYKNIISYILLIALLIGCAKVSAPPYKQIPAVKTKTSTTEVISVAQGQLTGVSSTDNETEIFAGIPYAKAPVGELRWKEPQPAESWDGVLVCDTYSPMAMQKEGSPIVSAGNSLIGFRNYKVTPKDNYKEARSEDCLYLNVWRPKNVSADEKLPVLVYIHGGSLNSGQAYYDQYNGEALAKQGIIFVAISYRLGIFGYMASDELAAESPNGTTGNYGLLDQIASLEWVQENISSFGGDPTNVTIAGESAGASAVNALCVSPLAKGLFRRAVAESSGLTAVEPYHTFRTLDEAKEHDKAFLEEFNCKTFDELRDIPAEDLIKTSGQISSMTIDGYAITEEPYKTYEAGNNNEEAVLGGFNSDEAYVFNMFKSGPKLDDYEEAVESLFGDYADEIIKLYPATTDKEAKANYDTLCGLCWFGYSHYKWSEYLSAQGKPAYMYYFTKDNDSLGPWHAGELPYMYGNLDTNKKRYDDADYITSEAMQTYLVSFVKYGDPNADRSNFPEWIQFNDSPKQVMEFGDNIGMIKDPYLKEFNLITEYMNTRRIPALQD